jgi:hypothetical protein
MMAWCNAVFRRPFSILLLSACGTAALAEPLSRRTEIDFFRDVPSRNLKALATRSDGRLVAGPTLNELTSPAPADLLWSLEPTPDPARWLVGTGPDGRIIEVTFNFANPTFTARDIAKLDDPQVFAVRRRADGSLLAGTSPKGALYLIQDEKPVARALLPVDSIFDLILLDDNTALAATGNPGRIYRIDLTKFAGIGLIADKITDTKILAERGISVFGEIRDRNVRRIAALPDGRIVAGSAPRGNVYVFPSEGGPPIILQENRDAEVTDLLVDDNGDVFATLVFATTTGQARITPPPTKAGERRDEPPPPVQVERFGGRSALVLFPEGGYPETLTARANMAFYRLARFGDTLVISGGEQGELIGFDLKARLSLTFAGSISAQVNAIAPLRVTDGAAAPRFLLLRNNAPGFAVLDFNAEGPREAETRRLDLGTAAQLGALRFTRLRNLAENEVHAEVRTSHGSDEVEGWSPWTPLTLSEDGGWRGENLRGRYVNVRLRVGGRSEAPAPVADPGPAPRDTRGTARSAAARPPAKRGAASVQAAPVPAPPPEPWPLASTGLATFEINRALLFWLPQNRRPQLQDFRVLTPGYGVIPAAEQPPSAVVSLRNLMDPPREDERRRSAFLGSQVVPVRGAQVVIWNVTDPDGDRVVFTFSIRREGHADWVDLATESRESYIQFDTAHLPDGVYFTRLIATETAPRPPGERLAQTFETDDLIIDHTPPELLEATARRMGDDIVVTVRGRDELSLLDGIEVVFNNGLRETVQHPVDGVRDGREETFQVDVPIARVSNATSVEVTLYDAAGNATARRLTW